MAARSQPIFIAQAHRRFSPLAFVKTIAATRRERCALGKLDARLLDDIGLTPREAWSETRRPLWEQADRHNR